MTVPTRMIDYEEFKRILAQTNDEDDLILPYNLTPYFYDDEGMQLNLYKPIKIIPANVIEPLIFKDPSNGEVFILFNEYEEPSYTLYEELHYNRGADVLMVSPVGWNPLDLEDELWYAAYYFKSDLTELPKLDIENITQDYEERARTH